MEISPAERRRLEAVNRHLIDTNNDLIRSSSTVQVNLTSSHFVDRQGYAVSLPEKLQTGKWNVYRSVLSPFQLLRGFPDYPEIETVHDNFVHAVKTFRDRKYLGTRIREDGTVGDYRWMTYGEASNAREAIGSGLQYHGLSKGVRIGLYFINRPEWVIIDHACSAYSYISVPLYDTLGPGAVKYVVNHSAIQAIFCVPDTLNMLLSFISEIPSVQLIVVINGVDEFLPSLPSTSTVKLISYKKLLSQGHSNLQPFFPPEPLDVATICYTSGTTGTPKGVVLTHQNLISSCAGFSVKNKIYHTDVYLSYLPLAHIYDRSNQLILAHHGAAIGFYQGDNMKLMDDLAILKPTIFCSVPRLFNRLYAGITNSVKNSGTLKQKLFTAAYNSKREAMMNGQTSSFMWEKLVFTKIKEKLGGKVRFMASAASPLSPDVMEFLKVCFGCQVTEAYGLTETAGLTCNVDDGDSLTGHVGSPNPACEVKLVDVLEMNYTSENQPYPRGEVCVRGFNVFGGYYKDEVQTRDVLDDDGWLHTGDIGLWLPGGRLKIIDRKKNIFKLAQGEYVAPEKIENAYLKCKFVGQCFIYGDSTKSSVVAVVAVDPDALKGWAAAEGIKFENLEQLCNDPRARAAVLQEMNKVGKQSQLRGFEFAKAVTLVPEPFSMENGLLTPTLKIKRPQAKEYFARAISNMYTEVSGLDLAPHKTSRM